MRAWRGFVKGLCMRVKQLDENEVKSGKLLLIVHGTPAEVEHTRELLDQSSSRANTIHPEPIEASI